jgi:hypothetical protein
MKVPRVITAAPLLACPAPESVAVLLRSLASPRETEIMG